MPGAVPGGGRAWLISLLGRPLKTKDIVAIGVGLAGVVALVLVDVSGVVLTEATRMLLEGLAAMVGPALGWGARGALHGKTGQGV